MTRLNDCKTTLDTLVKAGTSKQVIEKVIDYWMDMDVIGIAEMITLMNEYL